ncbi:HD domain-containing protein [Pseudodesulfovibrio piezophilus]|uniref:Metal-dependent phosphohydrolase HD region n=1 Tax=Pseudodesulfovibrio piezophilus (strain DSM 21447 / JCM 15486 / C1TLV30) TaxID=1322246 RepID=M1WPW5_PSEP2|nr:HD domain-containing protein [Pseudodesulfovibrio piezophilus]CCH48629.1 Metal-dependent phosphohydrolase HD region [Pseudodesulfovibrio piezophilus C1TLV30]
MQTAIQLYIRTPEGIDQEVRSIVTAMFPESDFSTYSQAFADVRRLYAGFYPGFQQCDTPYHNWHHTLDVLLATARLLHGIHLARQALSPHIVQLTLIAALFHDCGYIRREDEHTGTGAQFTLDHVQRGLLLLEDYSDTHHWPIMDLLDLDSMLQCTAPSGTPETVVFTNIESMLAAHVLATADIVAQMGSDIYLERLPLLFKELTEGGITDFSSEYDLFTKTRGFTSFMWSKMECRLSNVINCMPAHFKERYNIEHDFYSESALRNLEYLESILARYGKEYSQGLRRSLNRSDHPIKHSG